MVDLVVLNGSRAGACFALPDVPIVVGRSPEANLRIDDPWISNMHALIEPRQGELWVVDLGSRNGTFVGTTRVTEGRLELGTALAFGRTRLELRARTPASAHDSEPMRTPIRLDLPSVTAPHQVRPVATPAAVDEPEPSKPREERRRSYLRRGALPGPKKDK